MLDVIGAGATATSNLDWHGIWNASLESRALQAELDDIHTEGRSRPAVTTEIHSEFATGWTFQLWELLKRASNDHYRNPDYLVAKLVLNAVGGLFIGFTFFKSKDSQQATQNKLFVRAQCISGLLISADNMFSGNLHGYDSQVHTQPNLNHSRIMLIILSTRQCPSIQPASGSLHQHA